MKIAESLHNTYDSRAFSVRRCEMRLINLQRPALLRDRLFAFDKASIAASNLLSRLSPYIFSNN